MTSADLLAECDAIEARLEAMHASALEFISSGCRPNWTTPEPIDIWWPPHPHADRGSIHPGFVGLAVTAGCGAAAIALALALARGPV